MIECDTKLLYAMQFVLLENVGVWEFNVLKHSKLSTQAIFMFLVLGDAQRMSGIGCKEEEASLNSPKQIMRSTNTL